jgi:hypothetical protein
MTVLPIVFYQSQRINIVEDSGQGNDLVQNIIHGIADGDFEGSTKFVDDKLLVSIYIPFQSRYAFTFDLMIYKLSLEERN